MLADYLQKQQKLERLLCLDSGRVHASLHQTRTIGLFFDSVSSSFASSHSSMAWTSWSKTEIGSCLPQSSLPGRVHASKEERYLCFSFTLFPLRVHLHMTHKTFIHDFQPKKGMDHWPADFACNKFYISCFISSPLLSLSTSFPTPASIIKIKVILKHW